MVFGGHHPKRDLHSVTGRGVFKIVFEIIRRPGLLKFFQAEDFDAFACSDVNGIFMGLFRCGNKMGNFGDARMVVLRGFI